MVSAKDIRLSNDAFKASKKHITAVFVGGTGGVGKGTLLQLAKHAYSPTVYIIGRSEKSAMPLLDELNHLNPEGKYVFIETDVSLIKNVDKGEEMVHPSQMVITSDTSEGIDTMASLSYYSRLRFTYNLLPLLSHSPNGRVVSILAGGRERGLDINDLELRKKYSVTLVAQNCATQTVLSFEVLAQKYSSVTFCHLYPGFVNTGQLDKLIVSLKGVWRYVGEIARWTLIPLLNYFAATTIDVAGERGLFIATSGKYPPADSGIDMLVLPEGVETAKSSVTMEGRGNGVYRLHEDCESISNDCDLVLEGYRNEGTRDKVWKETEGIWKKALLAK